MARPSQPILPNMGDPLGERLGEGLNREKHGRLRKFLRLFEVFPLPLSILH